MDVSEPRAAWFEKALAVAGLLVFMGTIRYTLSGDGTDSSGGSPLFQLISGCLYLTAIVVLVGRGIPPWAVKTLVRSWPLVLLTLLPLLSTAWSQSPEVSFRRAITLLLTSAFAFFFIVRFDYRTIIRLIVISFAIYLFLSLMSAAIPGVGITPSGIHAGTWRGLTGQKNLLGRTAALAVVLLPLAATLGLSRGLRIVVLPSVVVALALLLLSTSKTSLVVAVASIPVGALLYVCLGGRIGRARLRPVLGIPLLLIASIVGGLAVTYGQAAVLEALGRDPTFTGRTKIWHWALSANESRSWLGSGFRAFWIEENTRYFFEYIWVDDPSGERSDTSRGPDHAHSGYVDMYLELGRIGVAALVVMVLAALVELRQALRRGDMELGFMFSAIAAFLFIYAFSERSLLQHSEDLWFFFVIHYLFMAKGGVLIEMARRPAAIPLIPAGLMPSAAYGPRLGAALAGRSGAGAPHPGGRPASQIPL